MYIIRGDFAIDAEIMKSVPCHILGSKDYYSWLKTIKGHDEISVINMSEKMLATYIRMTASETDFGYDVSVNFTVVLDNRKLSIEYINK